MKILRFSLGALWGAIAIAVTVIWAGIGFLALYTFLTADGNPPNTYTGQADDKYSAWVFLGIFLAWTVVAALVVIWPLVRWNRKRARRNAPTAA